MLDASNLSVSYGAILAVRSIDLKITRGSLSALLGVNEAPRDFEVSNGSERR